MQNAKVAQIARVIVENKVSLTHVVVAVQNPDASFWRVHCERKTLATNLLEPDEHDIELGGVSWGGDRRTARISKEVTNTPRYVEWSSRGSRARPATSLERPSTAAADTAVVPSLVGSRRWQNHVRPEQTDSVTEHCASHAYYVIASSSQINGHLYTTWSAFIMSTCFYRTSYASTVLAVIVCLSVRPSVTSRSCTKMAKRRITLTTSYDSPGILVFRRQKYRRNSNDITPTGDQIEVG